MFNNYFDKIIKTSEDYLKKILTDKEFDGLIKDLKSKKFSETKDYVHYFDKIYCDLVKKNINLNMKVQIKNLIHF